MENISDTMGVNRYDIYTAKQDDATDMALSERIKKAQEEFRHRNIKQREKEKNARNLQGLMLARIRLEAQLLPEAGIAVALNQDQGQLLKKFLDETKGGALNTLGASLSSQAQVLPDDLGNLIEQTKLGNASTDLLPNLGQPNIPLSKLSKEIVETVIKDDASIVNTLMPQGSVAPLLADQEKINNLSGASQKKSMSLANVLHSTRLLSAMQSQAAVKLDDGEKANNLIYRFDKWGATHSVSVSAIDGRGDLTNIATTVVLQPSDDLVGQRLTTHLPTQEHGGHQFLIKDYRDQSPDQQSSQQREFNDEQE